MVVFDSSTLILVSKVEILDLFLATINLPVAIPAAVEKECCGGKKTLDGLVIQKALDESRIRCVRTKNRRLVLKLEQDFNLGKGEAEAIALALNEKAKLLAIDDKNGMNACKLLGVPFTTAIGILIGGKEKGLLERTDALQKLALLAVLGRYKETILEDARMKLEAQP